MERTTLIQHLRALAQASDLLLGPAPISAEAVAQLQAQLTELQRQPLAGPGIDLAIENAVRRLPLKLSASDLAETGGSGSLLARLFGGSQSPEARALLQQERARKAITAFRKEIGYTLFAIAM